MSVTVVIIATMRQVYSAPKALLPSGLNDGDLGYATDEGVLYRWDGSAWVSISQAQIALEGILTIWLSASPTAINGFQTPGNINDGNTATDALADAVGEGAELDFGAIYRFKRWRQFGDGYNLEDGLWKIQYYSLSDYTWKDWVVDIPTRFASTWSDYVTELPIITSKLRLLCTKVDSYGTGDSGIAELEVIY